jgi:hypothetical protein
MTVAEVWGRVQGSDVLPLSHNGDDWLFPAPPGMSGTLICEFWAEDDAGNVGYRAAILTIAKGSIKCWRWLSTGTECTMLAFRVTAALRETDRPSCALTRCRSDATACSARPECVMLPHACPMVVV